MYDKIGNLARQKYVLIAILLFLIGLVLMLTFFLLAACSTPTPQANTADARSWDHATPDELTNYAQSLLGVPYRYGGNSPDSGFDCSGFVDHVFRHVSGIDLPRSSIDISHRGRFVSREDLQVGDLVFFNTLRRKFSHVGIYLGDGNFIHAPSSGGSIRIDELTNPYWRTSYNGARRIID